MWYFLNENPPRIFLPAVSHYQGRMTRKLWLPMMMITLPLPPYCTQVITGILESELEGQWRFNQSRAIV